MGPNFAYRSFCPSWNLVGECRPQTLHLFCFRSLQSVESVQAGLLTGHSLHAVEGAGQAVGQADSVRQSTLSDIDGPVGAGVLLDLGIISHYPNKSG